MPRTAVALVVLLVGACLTGCGSGAGASGSDRSGRSDGARGGSASRALTGGLTVLAAASLTEAFTTIGRQFEAANPGVEVTFGFAGSSALVRQVTAGAPADVFASASTRDMDAVVSAGDALAPEVFATNVMAIAVPPSNPGSVTGLDSLGRAEVTTALCQPQVPCGSTAAEVFAKAGVSVEPVTLEPDVKSVLSKVQLGEVDAGVVYATDVRAAAGKVRGVEIPTAVNAATRYPVAALSSSANPAAAAAFVDYVLSPQAADVLAAAGFQRP